MPRITIMLDKKEQVETDIQFPLYRKHCLDDSTIYMKVESVDKEITLDIDDGLGRIEIEIGKPSWYDSAKYLFGLDEFELSAEQYEQALAKVKDIVARL